MAIKKREPTLADMFLTYAPTSPYTDVRRKTLFAPHFFDTTCDNLRQAHRFVFDDQATAYVGEMIREMPRIIADAQDFAIPPFQKTWIEYSAEVMFETIAGQPILPTGDLKVGYLIVGPVVRVITYAKTVESDYDVTVLPIQYKLFQPWTIEQELDFCNRAKISRMQIDSMYWGSSANILRSEQDKEGLRALRANHSVEVCTSKVAEEHQVMSRLWEGMAGDVRNIIAMLLFMNRTSKDTVTREIGHGRGMFGSKPGPMLKHSVISLKLNPLPRLRTLVAGPGVWRRLHDVRGHFCHNKEARFSTCDHDWEETKPLHWECKNKCGGVRWWRHEHQRGHVEKGIVTSRYHVTK